MGSALLNFHAPEAKDFLRWRLAIPPEKGGWVWWIGPLVVGAAAAPGVSASTLLVVAGGFCAFCLRQPLTLAVKQVRRGQWAGLEQPLAWSGVYALLLLCIAAGLWRLGHPRVVLLGAIAAPVFAWYLGLVYLRRDRHQQWLDLAAAAALGLTAPAAYFAGGGSDTGTAFWLWALPAAQSAASVVHMLVRLEQRALREMPARAERLRSGVVPMLAHLAALTLAVLAWRQDAATMAAILAMLVPAAEGAYSIAVPQVRQTPKQLGMRQLAISSISMLLLAVAFALT